MAYRNNNNRRGGGGGSGGGGGGSGGGGGGGGGGSSSNFGNNYGNRINPWDAGVGGVRVNNDALSFANSLINNLLGNQNANHQVPSLLDGVQSSRFDDMNGYNFIRNRYTKNRNINGRGIRKPDAVVRSKNVLSKNYNKPLGKDALGNAGTSSRNDHSGNKGVKKGNPAGGPVGGSKEKSSTSKVSPYMDVSNDFLYCHMCDKHMYDATSFENHITGRTHRVMKESIEESYRMRATLLRQEARIAEQLKTIEIDRLKRMGKAKNYYKVREYCPMCELFFYGHIIAHRRSEKHLDLKKFLHPKCDDCELEFHNRTEYDDHLLSVVHMKNCKSKPSRLEIERKAKQLTISTMNDELLDIREEIAPKKRKEKDTSGTSTKKSDIEGKSATKTQLAEQSASGGTEENGESSKVGEEGTAMAEATADDAGDCSKPSVEDGVGATLDDPKLDEECPEDEMVKEEESEDCILDYKPGDEIAPEIDNKLPRYKKNRALGLSLIGKLECVECRICHKYFDSEATGEVHARTHSHYRAFIRFLNEKAMEVRIAQKRAAVALEEAEAAKKKQKLVDEKKCTGEQNGEQANNGEGEKKDSDLYDPSEATESGDASMAEDGKSDDGHNGSEQVEPMETEAASDLVGKDGARTSTTPANEDDESGAQTEADSSKEDDSKESKDDKPNPKGGNRRGRNTRSGRFAGRY
ncbi:zinc finger protein on ecdysone puffs isoform X1 [Anopheles arabiensis]|uniref:zinc finger protein on ecdysone puffs isoform X1 n=1 Tax=Anopheles arabiensis TaxID=7173 RepID=UPI001AACD167|nr:zinc finger protein on ecdysone puffs isoform X1 [Anopheles arabiensis]XP_040152379.1 zinc finger protein on ecdysone puffs isoform X1 [Anopheles arabiensis]